MDLLERAGRGPVVVVAPHGGISDRDLLEPPDRAVRSNDLHTAGLALQLAERVDGSLVANPSLDRNRIDLNRIDEVSARAPRLLDSIASMVERAVAAHGRAELVFVHGWHVVQPRCDIGLGARFARASEAPSDKLTVGAAYLAARIEPFRRACTRIGVDAAFGERWPGAHPNNLLQVFRRCSERVFDGAAGRLAGLAREGHIEAVQLELGASLRWPGAPREAFVAAFGRGFGTAGLPAVEPDPPAGSPAGLRGDERTPALGLRFFDPAAGPAGLGLVAGVGPMPGGRTGGRLLLFPGEQRLVLFTGEARHGPPGCVGGLRFETVGGGIRLRFEGPALAARDGREHFRSERAQLAARVADVAIDLEMRGEQGGFGIVTGRVEVDGRSIDVETPGFAGLPWRAVPGAPQDVPETRLAAVPGGTEGLVLRLRGGQAEGFRHPVAGEAGRAVGGPATLPGAGVAPFSVDLGGSRLRCEPRCHLSWLRTDADGRAATVTVGVLACDLDPAGRGGGIFEHQEPRSPSGGGRENPGLPIRSKVS